LDKIFHASLSFFSAFLNDVMPGFLNLLRMENVPQALSMTILVMMTYVIFRALRSSLPLISQLKKCNTILVNFPTEGIHSEQLGDLEEIVAAKGKPLRGAWQKFKQTLIIQQNDVYALSIRPIMYFCIEDFENIIHLKRLAKWSGLFVGIGLLCTFLGLVAALDSASQSITAATQGGQGTEAMQVAIKNLLHAATFKFFTSIFGLFASLVVTYSEKSLKRAIENRLDVFRNLLESKLAILTPEMIAYALLRESGQQTTQLKTFNNEMSDGLMQMSAAVVKSLESAVTPVQKGLEQVNAGIGSMEQSIGATIGDVIGSNMRNMQEETMKVLAEKLSELMNQQAGTELTTLVSTLAQLSDALAEMRSSLDSGGGAFSQQLGEAARELRSGVSELSDAARRMSEGVTADVSKAQSALIDNLRTVGDEMANSLAMMREATHSTSSTVVDQSGEAVRSIQNAVERMVAAMEASTEKARAQTSETANGLVATLEKALGGLTSVSETVRENMKQALESTRKELTEQGKATASSLTAGTNSVLDAFNSSVDFFKIQISEMKKDFEGIRDSMGSFEVAVALVSKESRDIAEAMRGAATSIRTVSDPLAATNREFSNSLRELRASQQAMVDGVRHVSAASTSAAEASKNAGESLKRAWEQHEARFKGVDEGLGRTMHVMVAALDSNAQKIKDYVTTIDQYLGGAVGSMVTAIEEMSTLLEDVKSTPVAATVINHR